MLLAFIQRWLRAAAASHTARSQPHASVGRETTRSLRCFREVEARHDEADSSVGCKQGAAIAGVRRLGLLLIRCARRHLRRFLLTSAFPHWLQPTHTLRAARSHACLRGLPKRGCCLDFQAHWSQTARAVACVGCDRGPAVYSVRSWAYKDGIPRSLQIFLARSSLISEWRGTVDVLRVVRFTKMEWFREAVRTHVPPGGEPARAASRRNLDGLANHSLASGCFPDQLTVRLKN